MNKENLTMQAQDLMTRNMACCVPATSLQSVAQMMVEYDCGAIPVVDSHDTLRPVGIVTDRDIATRVVAKGYHTQDVTAGDCMSSPVIEVSLETSVAEICRIMAGNQIRRIVVVDAQGVYSGIIAVADLARHGLPRETAELIRRLSQPREPASTPRR